MAIKLPAFPEDYDAREPLPASRNLLRMLGVFFSAQKRTVIAILTIYVLYATSLCTPVAAALAQFLSTRIRYSRLSLMDHTSKGWFGGFLPSAACAMVAATGNIHFGLWYPIVIALMTVVFHASMMPERYRRM